MAAGKEDLRKTGISVVGDIAWGSHFCHFYETKQDLLDILIPYFRVGLETGEFCLWVVSDSLGKQEALKALRGSVPDADKYLKAGQIEIIAHTDWYLTKGGFDLEFTIRAWTEKLSEALSTGYAGMRVNGDTSWLSRGDWKDFSEYEMNLNDAFDGQAVILVCSYPLAAIAGTEVFDVMHAHQFAMARRQGEWTVLETPELIQAKQEIKRLNEDLEKRVYDRTKELAATNAALKSEIAEREQAEALLHAREQEFRAIVENAPDQIIRYDREFRRTYVNPAVTEAYDLPADALTGKLLGSVINDPASDIKETEVALVRQRIAAIFETGKSYEYELEWSMSSGLKYFIVRLFPELDLNGSVVSVMAISRDITERKRAEERLRATSEQLRALTARFQSIKEEEGTRISRELHDELGSAVTSLRWDLEEIDESISEAMEELRVQKLRAKIARMMRLIDTMVHTVKRIASELRPMALDTLGLIEAIELQARQFQERAGISVECDSASEQIDLDREQSIAVFRIFQEALTNILRHAGASRVYIQMKEEDGEFILSIRDDGRGITEDERSGVRTLGLLGMQERAHLIGGRIDISGSDGKGTVVAVRIPIAGEKGSNDKDPDSR